MADPTEILLNVLGWIVAGLVTLGGILVAHRVQERSRERQEDRVKVYEPLRKEMELILRQKEWNAIRDAMVYWTASPEFEDIRQRGMLHLRRHDALRHDIERLLELLRLYEKGRSSFYDIRRDAMKSAWETQEAKAPGVSRALKLTEALGDHSNDDDFLRPLAADDKAAWVAHLKVIINGRGGHLEGLELTSKPEAIYKEVNAKLSAVREEYRTNAEAFLAFAEVVRSRLDVALRQGSRYRGD